MRARSSRVKEVMDELARQGNDKRTVAGGNDGVLVLNRGRAGLAEQGPGIVAVLGPFRPHGQEGLHGEDETLVRSEEHTSELQSRQYLVCRLLLEKKKRKTLQSTKPT